MTENTKLALRPVRYKISLYSVQSRHRSAICSINCGPSSRESNLSFWLDHQSLFLSPSLLPLVNWTSAGLLKPRLLSHSLSPHENNRDVQAERARRVLYSADAAGPPHAAISFTLFSCTIKWVRCTHKHTSLFNTAPGEAWNGKMSVWRKKMHDWKTLRHSFQNREREKDGGWMICWPSIGAPV